MEFKRTYTLVEIARKLERPRTTVKEWADLFREFLPTIGSGRTMRYEEEALDIFAVIEKMKDAGEPNDLIRDTLQQTVTELAVTVVDDEPKTSMQQFLDLPEEIRRQHNEMLMFFRQMDDERRREHNEIASKFTEQLEEVKQENEVLKEQIARLTKAVEDSGEAHDQRLTQVLREMQTAREEAAHKKRRWWQRG